MFKDAWMITNVSWSQMTVPPAYCPESATGHQLRILQAPLQTRPTPSKKWCEKNLTTSPPKRAQQLKWFTPFGHLNDQIKMVLVEPHLVRRLFLRLQRGIYYTTNWPYDLRMMIDCHSFLIEINACWCLTPSCARGHLFFTHFGWHCRSSRYSIFNAGN